MPICQLPRPEGRGLLPVPGLTGFSVSARNFTRPRVARILGTEPATVPSSSGLEAATAHRGQHCFNFRAKPQTNNTFQLPRWEGSKKRAFFLSHRVTRKLYRINTF